MRGSFRAYRRAAWIVAAVVPLVVWADPASADEALSRFERGVQLYEAENYDGALVDFNAAYKLTKNYKLLYNIGICLNALKDYVGASEAFHRYLTEGGNDVAEARRADVKERLSKLSLMITHVRITTDAPPGSTLLVDDQPAGTTPLSDDVTVKVGRRQVAITANGRTITKSVDAAFGESAPVSLLFADSSTSGPRSAGNAPIESTATTNTDGPSFPWPFWGLTAVLVGGAAVTGVVAVSARNDFEQKQATFGIRRADLDADLDKARTFGIVTDALLACSIVSAGVSTYLTVRYFGKKKNDTGITIAPMGIGYARSF